MPNDFLEFGDCDRYSLRNNLFDVIDYYESIIAELESYETMMANVASPEDWLIDVP